MGHFVREISVGYPVIPSLVHFLDLSKLYYLVAVISVMKMVGCLWIQVVTQTLNGPVAVTFESHMFCAWGAEQRTKKATYCTSVFIPGHFFWFTHFPVSFYLRYYENCMSQELKLEQYPGVKHDRSMLYG